MVLAAALPPRAAAQAPDAPKGQPAAPAEGGAIYQPPLRGAPGGVYVGDSQLAELRVDVRASGDLRKSRTQPLLRFAFDLKNPVPLDALAVNVAGLPPAPDAVSLGRRLRVRAVRLSHFLDPAIFDSASNAAIPSVPFQRRVMGGHSASSRCTAATRPVMS